jgi:hypothetical protein
MAAVNGATPNGVVVLRRALLKLGKPMPGRVERQTITASLRAPLAGNLGGPWLGGKPCQGRQPPQAGAAGPPLQGMPQRQTMQIFQ